MKNNKTNPATENHKDNNETSVTQNTNTTLKMAKL